MREPLELQLRLLAALAALLAHVHAGRRHRRQRHAVAHEEDHVACAPRVRSLQQVLAQRLLGAVAPEGGRLFGCRERTAVVVGMARWCGGRRGRCCVADEGGIVGMLIVDVVVVVAEFQLDVRGRCGLRVTGGGSSGS